MTAPADEPGRHTLRFTWTADDTAALLLTSIQPPPQRPAWLLPLPRLRYILFFIATSILVFRAGVLISERRLWSTGDIVLAIVWFVLLISVIQRLQLPRRARQFAEFVESQPAAIMFRGEETEVVVGPEGIASNVPGRRIVTDWRNWFGTSDRGGFLVLREVGGGELPLPARVFRDDPHRQAFISDFERWMKAGDGGAANIIRRYLAKESLSCPRCAYDLRGVEHEGCPECGLAFTDENFPVLFMHDPWASPPRQTR